MQPGCAALVVDKKATERSWQAAAAAAGGGSTAA